MKSPLLRSGLPLILALGIVVFAAGLSAAVAYLPEWRQDALPEKSFFQARLSELLSTVYLEPSCTPRLEPAGRPELLREAYRQLGRDAEDWLSDHQRAVTVQATLLTHWESSPLVYTRIFFSGRGEVWSFESQAAEWSGFIPGNWLEDPQEMHLDLARALTRSHELAQVDPVAGTGATVRIYGVPDASDQVVATMSAPAWANVAKRHLASAAEVREALAGQDFAQALVTTSLLVLRFLGASVVFVVLAFKRRLGMANAAILAGAVLITSSVTLSPGSSSALIFLGQASSILLKTVFVFLLWASAESWMRSTIPGFSTSLDVLRTGRLGPRGGRSLLGGWALGSAQAGLGLVLFALAVHLPGVRPDELSVPLPIFGMNHSPLEAGVMDAGFLMLALAAGRNLLPSRWVVPFAAIAGAVLNLTQADLEPWPFALASSFVFSLVLIYAFHRFGLTGLLTAALVDKALPAAVFAGLHAEWLPLSAAATGLFCVAVPLIGWIGLRRPREPELERMVAPAYIRRLEDERRLRYELDLLARMQKGLLPEAAPAIDGYQVAATSILANEAGGDLYDFLHDDDGGLWLAAGDVSGHGLSCTIELAMTKAALASLVRSGARPSQILHEVDRVLRTARSVRSFTSLCLLRLDPRTGEVVFSNAGHPYPLLLDGQDLSEISLPSLPLGQGPQRQYRDQMLNLRQGSVLVLLSDGLFESANARGTAYGYPRTRFMLAESVHLGAVEILEAVMADWRRHIGDGSPADDTTLVVLKRT